MLDSSGAVLFVLPFQLAVAGTSDTDSSTMSVEKTSESRLFILGTLHIFTFRAGFSNSEKLG